MINSKLLNNLRNWYKYMTYYNMIKKLKAYGELVKGTDFQFVTIHPLSDEIDHLVRLGMMPEDVILCDLYWAFRGNMFFVSVYFNKEEDANISCHLNQYTKDDCNFNIITHHTPIDTDFINKILNYLSIWIISNSNMVELKRGQRIMVLRGEIFNTLQV